MAKVTTNFSGAKRQINKFKKNAKTNLLPIMKNEIISSIERGVSPVKGGGRFQRYSESYRQQIKGKLTFFTHNKKVIPIRPRDILTGFL